jgi:hypothetical protein
MNAGVSTVRIPAQVSDKAQAMVMAVFAEYVEAVNGMPHRSTRARRLP